MVQRFEQKKPANESTQRQGGGISSLQQAKGQPNAAKSHPGVSGRPLEARRQQPPPPPGSGRMSSARPPEPPRHTGGGGGERATNVESRIRGGAGGGTVPPQKLPQSGADNVAGKAGRTKKDDVDIAGKTPLPPPPPGKDGLPAEKTDAEKATEKVQEETGAPIDPATGLPQKPDFDGEYTDEEGNALNPDGTPVTDPETGAPMNPEAALAADIKAETGATSNFMAEKEAREQKEKIRRAAPSEIPGINTGHFEAITSPDEPAKIKGPDGTGLSEIKQKEYTADAKRQLAEFGDFPGAGDPDSPQPPIRPMGRSFNPYTGKFTSLMGSVGKPFGGFDLDAAKRDFYKGGGKADIPTIADNGPGVTSANVEPEDG